MILIGCILTAAAVILLVPPAKDELAWRWAQFQDIAPGYQAYLADWPNGRHIIEARSSLAQRRWAATKRSLIAQAYQQAARADAAPGADAAYRREKRLRREAFFWKQATNVNTIDAYRDYLHEYPLGQFTAQALSQIKKINPAAPELTPPR